MLGQSISIGTANLSVGAACAATMNFFQVLLNEGLGLWGGPSVANMSAFCSMLNIPQVIQNLITQFNEIFGGLIPVV
jgi:hypothetical protein